MNSSIELRLREIFFDGRTYDPKLDRERLRTQLERVFSVMKDGRWRTLDMIRSLCGGTEASISARLRDLRKPRFGGFEVERKRAKRGGLWIYRLSPQWPGGRNNKQPSLFS
jgi:hypothetical protein